MPSAAAPPAGSLAARLVFAGLGFLFTGLGIAGAVLPVLPTTPFLLLASFCFVRSFPAWNERLLRMPLLGGILRDWYRKKGVTRRVKLRAIITVSLVIGLSVWLSPLAGWWKGAMVALGLIGIGVIAALPRAR
jgi:hypothetical protein